LETIVNYVRAYYLNINLQKFQSVQMRSAVAQLVESLRKVAGSIADGVIGIFH
jgi:hypothetical protein